MLHEFLSTEREHILALCGEKILEADAQLSSSEEMERGLPILYDELIEVLRADEQSSGEAIVEIANPDRPGSAMRRGRESLRLGYTISQVVHGYGALCQAITEHASKAENEPINSREFNRLNSCLDVAIAQAVTEFSRVQDEAAVKEEVLRLGFLAHELRNSVAHAAAAHRMIQRGFVGVGGSTGKLLENALTRMISIIDRSLSEVRLRGETTVDRRPCRLVDLVGEVEATSTFDAINRPVTLRIDVASDVIIEVDRHLVISAISNLVQNAIKFTRAQGTVWVRSQVKGDRVSLEIEDECGGLPEGNIEELFRPFTQIGANKQGIGFGLSISRRAIELNEGKVSARGVPGKGCIFTIDLPLLKSASE